MNPSANRLGDVTPTVGPAARSQDIEPLTKQPPDKQGSHREPAMLRAFGGLIDLATITIGALIIVLVFANVLLHSVGHDLAWTTELSELLMVWVTFIGGAAAARRNEHVAITEILDRLGASGRRWADAVAQSVSAGVLGMLIFYGVRVVEAGWGNRLSVLDWPMGVEYLALPVGSAATLVFVLFDLYRILRGDSREDRFES